MKISKVFLRWYKSFNISYRDAGPARHAEVPHPWDSIDVGSENSNDYPFIEIPLEDDITTIVGGNESGKSHLLNAISKVITGKGLHGADFSQTDFCRYATVPNQNTGRWPNIGLEFKPAHPREIASILSAIGNKTPVESSEPRLVLIIGSTDPDIAAYIYINNNEQSIPITDSQLESIRNLLPSVRFINAEAALPDNLTLQELLLATGFDFEGKVPIRVTSRDAQEIAAFIQTLSVPSNKQLSETDAEKISRIKSRLVSGRLSVTDDARLAARLFTEVLGIKPETLSQVLNQPTSERGYTQYFLGKWNDQVFEKLDLAHFWQQDDQASLELVYKDNTLYFDVTDKTGATYTFKERSSGLRYFLSYYIQAKALQATGEDSNSIILMDEPDSFLSILGQRNLLSVFESLVGYERTNLTSQLLYTTHSPFLINRNFPRRIRVVVKEEAEEGTQFFGRGSSRRYEPVRSALGVDCAQTLFMGATNLVLEGVTDQFLLTEMVRIIVTPKNVESVLDLNGIVIVSADGVNNIEKVLASSQWGDEPIPATVVLVDGDKQGREVFQRISGRAQGAKRLIQEEFVLVFDRELIPLLEQHVVETIEDLVPRKLYARAYRKYLQEWHAGVISTHAAKIDQLLFSEGQQSIGNVAFVKSCVHEIDGLDDDLDKLSILRNVVSIVSKVHLSNDDPHNLAAEVTALIDCCKALFTKINDTIFDSRQAAATTSMSTNVKRIVREFLRTRNNGCSIVDLRRHLQRLGREAKSVPDIGENLREKVEALSALAQSLETQGQGQLVDVEWTEWVTRLEAIKRNPVAPDIQL